MNKTIIINISGIVFHIEEEAYENLRNYMISIKKHFGLSPESHEIILDIENRIAEMFTELLAENKKEVIFLSDVDLIIQKMGNVSDFERANDESFYSDQEASNANNFEHSYRKLMRDMDDKVLGGVASGLGHYFGIQAQWVRLIFLLLVLFGGTGVLIYLILWIVVPGARTRADRMEMRGEPVNIHSFKKNFDSEIDGLRQSINNSNSETSKIIQATAKAFAKFLRMLVKTLAVLCIGALCAGLIVLIISLFATFEFFGNNHELSMFPMNIIDPALQSQLLLSLMVVATIPLIALIGGIIHIIFNRTLIHRYFGFTLLILWLIALGFSTVYITSTVQDFKEESKLVEERGLEPSSIYHLRLNDIEVIRLNQDSSRQNIILQGLERRDGKNFYHKNRAQIKIVPIDSLQVPQLEMEFSAKGKNYEEATRRVQSIQYFIKQEGENLIFDSHPLLEENDFYRDQQVKIELKIPVGTRVIIEEDMQRNIYYLPFRQCHKNFEAQFGHKQKASEWFMTNQGLKCIFESTED